MTNKTGEGMNNKTIKQNAIRHGEVLIIPVESVPEGFEEQEPIKQFVVGHSETGHHHVAVAEGLNLIAYLPIGADSADMYLRVNKQSKLEHLKTFDKHETKTLNEGLYLVRPKTEYDPFAKLVRRVQD